MRIEIPFISFNVVIEKESEAKWLLNILECATPGVVDKFGIPDGDKVLDFRNRLEKGINKRLKLMNIGTITPKQWAYLETLEGKKQKIEEVNHARE